eukprot:GHVU01196628.1.p1 GENE.GHVU01196628.1~~GHVU01196628.1.p1  ORF type:complete len:112 (+),score=0.88 GHVU01196628.1:20-355(+)
MIAVHSNSNCLLVKQAGRQAGRNRDRQAVLGAWMWVNASFVACQVKQLWLFRCPYIYIYVGNVSFYSFISFRLFVWRAGCPLHERAAGLGGLGGARGGVNSDGSGSACLSR